jgi:hypothetical protein
VLRTLIKFFFFSDPSPILWYTNEKTTTQKHHPVINKLQSHLALASRNKLEIVPNPKIYQYQTPQHHIPHPHSGNTHQSLKQIHQETTNNFKLDSLPSYSTGIRINFGIAPPANINSGYKLNVLKANNYRPNVNFPQILLNASYKANSGNWILQNNNSIASSYLRVPENNKKFNSSLLMIKDYKPNTTTHSLSKIPPSVLTPFFQQVQWQQQNSRQATQIATQVSAPQNSQPNPSKPLNKTNKHMSLQTNITTPSHQNYVSYRIPYPTIPTIEYSKPLNISNHDKMASLSPLQDANKFSYTIVASQEFHITTPTTSLYIPYSPNDIVNTKNSSTREKLYPQLPSKNLKHVKEHQEFDASRMTTISNEILSKKYFLPTPNVEDTITKTNYVTSSYFTYEDAMTILPEHQTKFNGGSLILPEIPVTETILLPIHANNIVQIANKTELKQLDNSFIRQKPKWKRPKPLVYDNITVAPLNRSRFIVDSLYDNRKKVKLDTAQTTRSAILTTHKPRTTIATIASTFGRNKSGNNLRKIINEMSTKFPQKSDIATTERNNQFQPNNTRGKTKQITVYKIDKEVNKTIKINTQSPFTTSIDSQFLPSNDMDLITRDANYNNIKLSRFKSISKQRPKFSIKDYKYKITTETLLADEVKPTEHNLIQNIRIKYPVRTRLRNNINNKLNTTIVNQVSNSPKNNVFPNKTTSYITERPELTRTKVEPPEEPTTTTEISRKNNRRGSTQRSLLPYTRRRTTLANFKISNSPETTERSTQKANNKWETADIFNHLSSDAKTKAQLTTTESNRHETAIMKIAKDDSYKYKSSTAKSIVDELVSENKMDLNESSSFYSKRIEELTALQSKDQTVKFVNSGTINRKIPSFLTFHTENPILPIEAFFPNFVNFQTE